MDIKDIMGIKGDAKAPAAKKSKGPAEKKPEGVSREVWQITKGMQGDAPPPSSPHTPASRISARCRRARWRGRGSPSRTRRVRTTSC